MQWVITFLANEGDRASHYYWVAATDNFLASQNYKHLKYLKIFILLNAILFFFQEGRWLWESGATWSYSNWLKDQPSGGVNQNCLILLTGDDRKWDDLSCMADQFEFPICVKYSNPMN